jgi:predicted helicase
MSSLLRLAFDEIDKRSKNETERGNAFERLSKIYLEHDALQNQLYSKVWHYSDWAKDREGYNKTDIGIDLVAELSDGSGFAAIQCKFYAPDHAISKQDIDSFISASATADFVRLILIDTTTKDIGNNAQVVFDNLDKEYLRIPLDDLEESRVDWLTFIQEDRVRLIDKKTPMQHQQQALDAVREGFKVDDRGKIIMACGTGKTFTSLMIAEDLAGKGKLVLYMVPSLSLMSQSVRAWKNDCTEEFNAFSACSDPKVGQRNNKTDQVIMSLSDLSFPATTDPKKIAEQVANCGSGKMTVIFSTYHSIDVISRAQKKHGLPQIDLILCDEAHRTTGATLSDEDESNFVRIHDDANVSGKKRLYMTATPRIFGETAKSKADDHDIALASMDDEDIYGKALFYRGFGWAVENNLLTDYKVVVLAVDEETVSRNAQKSLAEGCEMKLDDATKIIGCYKALAKCGFDEDDDKKPLKPMKRALGFCQSINLSKLLEAEFANTVDDYLSNEEHEQDVDLKIEVKHVDGTFNAKQRDERLSWLKEDEEENNCRILTNARCLSEGVDIPSLDAIMFLHPRKSQIDVVQSVGRVMRKAEGKEMGYVILPIAIPPNTSPEVALKSNERYKVVWQILNALRTHDERFDSTINRIKLGEDVSNKIEIIGVGHSEEMEAVTATVDDIKTKKSKKSEKDEDESQIGGEADQNDVEKEDKQMSFVLDDLSQAIKAKIVEKCGTREYWETWAKDIAKIAQTHVTRIKTIVDVKGSDERKCFKAFLEELQDDLNPEISEMEAIEMLAQHLITKPVFDTLFEENQFTKENPVSKAMEFVLAELHQHNLEKESESLSNFYASVRRRATDIVTAHGRQQLVVELYDKFFRTAFPLLTQKLGIVYTPVEVVDFIIHSVNDVLKEEFKQTLGSKGVHIIDPFTGTGTFITRLLQSGLINKEELAHKYKHEIHANEIVLLAYYIAAVNIESIYHDLSGSSDYEPFDGMVLTDTFQLFEQEHDMIANLLPDNSNRRTAQKALDINVVIGNPPYSAGQKTANDNAANISYENLDAKIGETYATNSTATNKQDLYDSYIRAVRWASDRVGDEGVIGFVSNAGWIDGNATDGLRKCLVDDFSKIYIFHLRGNQRTQGETSRREGGKIFGSGSRTPVAISILVKSSKSKTNGKILFHDIGDYLDRNQKLSIIKDLNSISGISKRNSWLKITPDDDNDWLNQGDKQFEKHISIGNKKDKSQNTIFNTYCLGVATGRDARSYNFSKNNLSENMSNMIDFFNEEIERSIANPNHEICYDKGKISWDRGLLADLKKKKRGAYKEDNHFLSTYRPFQAQHFYFSRQFNNMIYLNYKFFPKSEICNRVICVTGIGSDQFSCLITTRVPDLNLMKGGAQCFPLKIFENNKIEGGLFDNPQGSDEYIEKDGISKKGFAHFQAAYKGESFTKEDLFYYIYGILHSPEYKERFQNNLSKELPRIPTVKNFDDFKAFSDAGRKLGELHVNYETVDPYPVNFKEGNLGGFSLLMGDKTPEQFFRVEKIKFGGKRGNVDKRTVIYNSNITMTDIPLEAYYYIVNGRSALEWVIDRQQVKKDRPSGIINDPNDYANETMNNPKYPLELFQRVITVSLETMKIVKTLPELDVQK